VGPWMATAVLFRRTALALLLYNSDDLQRSPEHGFGEDSEADSLFHGGGITALLLDGMYVCQYKAFCHNNLKQKQPLRPHGGQLAAVVQAVGAGDC